MITNWLNGCIIFERRDSSPPVTGRLQPSAMDRVTVLTAWLEFEAEFWLSETEITT